MKLILLVVGLLGLALLLLSVRVIFSRHHAFLRGHACHGAGKRTAASETRHLKSTTLIK